MKHLSLFWGALLSALPSSSWSGDRPSRLPDEAWYVRSLSNFVFNYDYYKTFVRDYKKIEEETYNQEDKLSWEILARLASQRFSQPWTAERTQTFFNTRCRDFFRTTFEAQEDEDLPQ